jgi:hypothetical protein
MGLQATYLPPVAELGLGVTILGVAGSVSYLYIGQWMLGRANEPALPQSLALAIVLPSGLILSNARATYEAFTGTQMVFVTTAKTGGAAYMGEWRGRPELTAGFLLPVFALAEQAWSAPFFCVAAAGLLSIGAMGWSRTDDVPAREVVPINNQN